MITVFDSSNYAQQVFLGEAFAFLASRSKLTQEEIDAGKFLSLDGYFAHMKDLVSVYPKYVMIPSDEDPFKIDANTRTINVPASFSKCAGVVGDNMCEIITFTIDRYFDYTDLANARICVQWKLPDANGESGEEGISHIGLVDLNTVSGKIRFGWPLTEALTKNAGNITFSVRFYVEKTVINEDKQEESQFVYLFNTLPATIPIRAGLNVEGEDAIVEQGVSDLFKSFVDNSANPSFPMPKPVAYVVNLDEQDKINEESDELILRAQATTAGDGWIDYKWYLKEGISDKTDTITKAVEIIDNDVFTIDNKDYQKASFVEWNKLPKNKQYYILDESDETDPYKRVEYKLVDGKHTFTVIETNVLVPENTQLYERFTKLIIEPRAKDEDGNWITTEESKKITGLYHVEAINSVGKTSIDVQYTTKDVNGNDVTIKYAVPGINSTPPLHSNQCYIPTPKPIELVQNLDVNTFINPVNKALLKALPKKDTGNPQLIYTWYKYAEDDIQEVVTEAGKHWIVKENAIPVEVASGVDMVNYITDEPGWYYAEIVSLLNRDTKELDSAICRVINPVIKPEVIKMEFCKWRDEDIAAGILVNDAWNPIYTAATEDKAEFIDEDGINEADFGNIFQLRVNIQDIFDSKLTSDEVTYKWYMLKPEDKEPTLIEAALMGVNSEIYEINDIDTNVLNIRCKIDVNDVKSAVAYYCEVTNTLAEKSETFTREDYKVMFLVH